MKKVKNLITIALITIITFSCTKEDKELQIENDSSENLLGVSLTSGCPDYTTGPERKGFYVTAGSPKDLTKYRSPYAFNLPINPDTGQRYQKKDVVGMGTDGDANLNFVWYKNYKYSAGKTDALSSVRSPHNHTYVLPENPETRMSYKPEDIVGMAIDGENNSVYAWYRNNYVSSGSPSNLGSKRAPYHYDLAVNPRTGREFKPGHIKAIAIDGELNRTIVFYKYRYVSEGKTHDLDYYTAKNGGQAYCIDKRPAININPKHFLGAGIDYTNQHVFIWSQGPAN